MAQRLRDRLARPIGLGTGNQPSEVHMGAHEWSAEVGIGVLAVPPEQNAAAAVNMARSMSRTALSYPSRIACYSDAQQEFVEVVLQPSPG